MTDDTKLHGPEQEMTVDEWKEIHNDERKSVKDMTNAELQEHYYKLLRVIRLTKIRVQASHLVLQERIEVADLEEREAIRERDKKYKVKPVISETGEKKERAPRQTQMAKLQGSLAGLGIDLSAMLKAKEAAKAPRKSAEEKLKESLGNLGLDPSKMMEKK